jgi:hypothetical protein
MSDTVYIVLFNYSGSHYSIVKTFTSLKKAYGYICQQECNLFCDQKKKYKMLTITKQQDIDEYKDTSQMGICFAEQGNCNKFDLDTEYISQFIIVPQVVEE